MLNWKDFLNKEDAKFEDTVLNAEMLISPKVSALK